MELSMVFSVHDDGIPTSKREGMLLALFALQNAQLFVREARDALLGNDDDLRQQLWEIQKDLSECIKDVQRQYKKEAKRK